MRAVPIIAVVASLAVGAGCGGDDEASNERPQPRTDAPPLEAAAGGHIHGLGVNPRDGALFIATHEGMFRAAREALRARRVGKSRQDTMGFTVTGPDHFLGSGHPDLQTELPPYLGLIESRDAGRTWKPRSLLGEVDFHALEVSSRTVYGSGSDFESRQARFLVSRDRGRTWQRRRPPEPIVSIAIDPGNASRIVAAGSQALYASDDAGRTWQSLEGPAGFVTFDAGDRLYLVDAGGGVHARDGEQWSAVGDVGGAPAALEAHGRNELLIALHDGTVKRSSDGGRTWTLRARL
jgi:hypothetical protein